MFNKVFMIVNVLHIVVFQNIVVTKDSNGHKIRDFQFKYFSWILVFEVNNCPYFQRCRKTKYH